MGYRKCWHVNSYFNESNRVCDTYAEMLILPKSFSDKYSLEDVQKLANFRKRNRFPIIAWVHRSNGACLVRCSQPKMKVKSLFSRCTDQVDDDRSSLMHFAANAKK